MTLLRIGHVIRHKLDHKKRFVRLECIPVCEEHEYMYMYMRFDLNIFVYSLADAAKSILHLHKYWWVIDGIMRYNVVRFVRMSIFMLSCCDWHGATIDGFHWMEVPIHSNQCVFVGQIGIQTNCRRLQSSLHLPQRSTNIYCCQCTTYRIIALQICISSLKFIEWSANKICATTGTSNSWAAQYHKQTNASGKGYTNHTQPPADQCNLQQPYRK